MVMHITEKYGLKKCVYILLLMLSVISLCIFLPMQYYKLIEDPEQFK